MPLRMIALYALVLALGITGVTMLWPQPEQASRIGQEGCAASAYRPAWVGTERAERFASVFR